MHSNYQPQKSPCVSSFPTTYKTLHYPKLQANIISSVLDHISVMPPCAVLHKLDLLIKIHSVKFWIRYSLLREKKIISYGIWQDKHGTLEEIE